VGCGERAKYKADGGGEIPEEIPSHNKEKKCF
jgi:hypothetical protein